MNWLLWLLIGLLAGGIAGRLVEGRGYGCLGNIIVGVIGGFVGGFIFDQMNITTSVGFWGSLVTATVGAVAFLLVLNLIKKD